MSMKTGSPVFVREVAWIEDPAIMPGNVRGHRVRRLIDGSAAALTDPFLVMAEDWMPRGTFPLHPHRGFETVTFVLDGSIEHRDSAGNGGVINAGDAQWMTAGRGVRHEEEAPAGTIAHTLQLWVNLPSAAKLVAPRYQDLRGEEMPVRREKGVEVRVFSGRSGDVAATTLNYVPVTVLDARVDPGTSFRQHIEADQNVFVYVLDGSVRVGSLHERVDFNQIAWLTRSENPGLSQIDFVTDVDEETGPCRFLFFAGCVLREPIAFGGPFVMNTEAELMEAYSDYRAGRF